MTSEKVHEQSWEAWDSKHLYLFLESLKTILHEIYVIPEEKKTRLTSVLSLKEKIKKTKAVSTETKPGSEGPRQDGA